MTSFSDFLSADAVEADVHATNKKALFQYLAGQASRLTGIDSKPIFTAIAEREKLGSTGFGNGVAIPHGRIEGLKGITGLFVRLEAPLPFQSIDQMPVDLVMLLLSPPDAGADHLKALARISRSMRDRQVLANLRGARSRDALYAVLTGSEARDAA